MRIFGLSLGQSACQAVSLCLLVLLLSAHADTVKTHTVRVVEDDQHGWDISTPSPPEAANAFANRTTIGTEGTSSTSSNNVNNRDPQLALMPGYDNVWAYRRADISSMYREAPGTCTEMPPAFTGQAGKFVNVSPERLDLYWDSGKGAKDASFICHAQAFGSCGTATFPGHVFYMMRPSTKEVVCKFRVHADTAVYYCDVFSDYYNPNDASCGALMQTPLDPSILNASQTKLYEAAQLNRLFAADYKNFTGGSEWLANYPAQPPQHFMWPASYLGQQHTVTTPETHFTALPSDLSTVRRLRRVPEASIAWPNYRNDHNLTLTLTVVSVEPRILQIDGFLSDVEVDHLLDLAHQVNIPRSTTGQGSHDARVSNVRTSRNTWLKRNKSPILDAIFRRAADVLKVDEALMRKRELDERPDIPTDRPLSEDLQLVHYDKGEQYTAHHDFSYPDARPNAPARSINLCMYLNEGMKGGETAFPRWRNGHTSEPLKAVPQKGKAMIFYMKNPDGNLDDLSQHAAMPVLEGEKWFANLWTWDPIRE